VAKVLRKMIVAHSGGVLPTVSVKKAEETPVGEAGVFITYEDTCFSEGALL